MDNITNYLNLPENAKVLDLACGKGRHSTYLNQLGFDVLGADLSENSIEASKDTNDTLHFKVHDMRVPLKKSTMLYLICLPALVISKMKRITLQL
jgi:cyclopropane fatty-acyl-phospholipid synthase-like methyltransferase